MNAKTNSPAKSFKLDWKKFAIFGVVIAIGAYQWYAEQNRADNPVAVSTGSDRLADESDDVKSEKKSDADSAANSTGTYLKSSGGKNLQSPAGLLYTGGQGEHRADHVLRHAQDIPNREGPHGVFDADGDDVFRLLDEAYELVKSKSKQVKTTPEGDGKTEYIIDMKRKIGYLGGQTGSRKNNPPLSKVKLILADNRVITAFPF